MRKAFSYFFILFLTACGGGGGGGGGSSSSSTLTPVVTYSSAWTVSAGDADVFRTSEYQSQWGLEAINAAQAYAVLDKNSKTNAGDGIIIGVVDSGVRTDHIEIADNYHSGANYVGGASDEDDNGHGTHVSSTAAGVKDGSGMHGVAYKSQIFAAKSLDADGDGSDVSVADGIAGAIAAGARVINLSLSGGSSDTLKDAMKAAKAADVLSVVATGNGGSDGIGDSNPLYPALYAPDPELIGFILAVGAVDSDGNIASFSNHCGDAKAYCLVAPGVDITAAYYTSVIGYGIGSGTSMAAPHVAGAAAVLMGAWPFLTADKVAQLLLSTADDLGNEEIYGQGMLDLYEATQAQGDNVLGYSSSVADGGYDLSSSSMIVSPIFGDAFATNIAPQLNKAVFFDDYGRDFKAFLGNKIATNSMPGMTLDRFLFQNIEHESVPLHFANGLGENATTALKINFARYKDPEAKNYYGFSHVVLDAAIDQEQGLQKGFSLIQGSQNYFSDIAYGFAFNIDEISQVGQEEFKSSFILKNNFAVNPYQSFFQEDYASLDKSNVQNNRQFNQFFINQNILSKKLALKFSYQSSYNSSQLFSNVSEEQNRALNVGFAFKPDSNKSLVVTVGRIDEFDNNILNSKSEGAFGSGGGVKTSYMGLNAYYRPMLNVKLRASFSEGFSKIAGNDQGIFREFNDVRSRSFSIGATHEAFLKGEFGIAYIEPLRVYQGTTTINIPTQFDTAGNIMRYSDQLSLVPQGKERDIEVFYSRQFTKDAQIKLNLITQFEPGHVKGAANNYVGFLQFSEMF